MRTGKFFRHLSWAISLVILFGVSIPDWLGAQGAKGGDRITIEEYQLFEGIIEPIVVIADSADKQLTLEHRIDNDLLELDPSCFHHDILMYVQKDPLMSSGLFSSQIFINGNRPEDTHIEIDRILKVYDRGKIQNVFGLFDSGVFETSLKRFGYRADGGSGFSVIDLETNPRERTNLALRFFDLSAATNFSLLNSSLFTGGKISWLDQVINRIFGQGFVCPHSQEFFSTVTYGPKRRQVRANFWWFREGSFIKTGPLTNPAIKKSYQTEADWSSEKEHMAFWVNNGVVINSKLYLELALSLYDTYRFDNAIGKSGMVGIFDPNDLFVDLSFSTKAVSSMMELSYFSSRYQINYGVKVSRITNRLAFNSEGYFYPGVYRSQRGDEISPEELKEGRNRSKVLDSSYWTNVNTNFMRLEMMAGVVASHRTGYPLGFSPRIQIGYPLDLSVLENSRVILSLGHYRQFPGPERVYVTMYPVSESDGKAEESRLLALGFRSEQLNFSFFGSKIRNLYSPGYENSRFSSEYADGYTAGFEVAVRNRFGNISSEFDYGYGRSVHRQEGLEYPSRYDPGHNASLSFLYRPSKKLAMTVRGDFGQGQRIHRLIAREETPEGYTPIWDPVPNSDRLPAMWRISMGNTFFLSDDILVSLFVVNFPGYPCAVMYEGWDPNKKSYVQYPFIFGFGTELNF